MTFFSIKWDLHSLLVINEDIEEEFNVLFNTMKRFLNRLRSIPDATFHYAPSKLGNQVCKYICKRLTLKGIVLSIYF